MLSLSLSLSSPLTSLSLCSPVIQPQPQPQTQTHHHFHGYGIPPLPSNSLSSPNRKPTLSTRPNSISPTNNTINEKQQQKQEEEEEDFQVLTATRSQYNNIVILESQSSKVLLLDDSGNVHSILYKGQTWTNSYWDEFSSLPPIIPQGPVAIFGLGGGTVAHQLLELWPSLRVDGWELDEVLVDRARRFFGLSGLEEGNGSGGFLRVCVGDALGPSSSVEGGYAGIVVDLFSDAKVLPELEKSETWGGMREKLMPGGRIMVNCGGVSGFDRSGEKGWEANLAIGALCGAFGGKMVNWKKMGDDQGGNFMALTGPLPDEETWASSVPEKLRSSVGLWRQCV